MKKIYILITVVILIFIYYLYQINLPRSYTLSYKMSDYFIEENYEKEKKIYTIIIDYKKKKYPLTLMDNYDKNRKIVDKIDYVNINDEKCLTVLIQNIKYPICYDKEDLKDFRLLSEDIKEVYQDMTINHSNIITDTYKNINIYNYFDKKIYIWNYKGYDFINKKNNRTFNLISKEDYYNSLTYFNDKYIITPNYDTEYYFDEYFVLDIINNELSSIKLDNDISYSTYYQGEVKKNIYLVDKKNKKQYKLNIKKEDLKTVGTEKKLGVTYNKSKNKWESISLNKLVNKEHKFSNELLYDYQIINNKLYLLIGNYKILISNNKVKAIVHTNNEEVFYIVEDVLYAFSPHAGEVKLIENNEWNFNYTDKIYIYD